MSVEWINGHENDLFVLWVMHVTNPLNCFFIHVESKLLVSLVLTLNILVLNKLSGGIL